METVFCKYDTYAKFPQAFRLQCILGSVISMKSHPQEVLDTNAKKHGQRNTQCSNEVQSAVSLHCE